MTPGGQDINSDLSRMEYLRTLVPHSGEAAKQDQATGSGTQEEAAAEEEAPPVVQISEEAQAALPATLQALFRHHSVCNLNDIRLWLKEFDPDGPTQEAAKAPDTVLQKAVLACDNMSMIRGSFFPTTVGSPEIDEFRALLIDLLSQNRQIKRADVVTAVKAAKVAPNDGICTKVLKSLCVSRGHYWVLKAAAR